MPVLRPLPPPSRSGRAELIVPDPARPAPSEPDSPTWWRDRLYQRIVDKQPTLTLYRDYYDGRHELNFATRKFHEAFGNQFKEFANNLCPLVVDSAAQRLRVQGFRFGGGEDADRTSWEMWQRNALDAESALLHTEVVKVGEGYVLVSPDPDEAEWPLITVEDPSHCEVEVDPVRRRRRLAGLKCWTDPLSGLMQATLWLPREVHRWTGVVGRSNRVTWYDRDEPEVNDLGVVPLVRFVNAPGLYGGRSDLEPVVPLIRALNKTGLDMAVTAEFNSYRQRIVSGIGEMRDQNGQPVQNLEEVLGSTRIMTFPSKDVDIHEFDVSDPGVYIKILNWYSGQISAVSSTPLPYMSLEGQVFPASGEALKVSEVRLVAKDQRKCVDLGESWEEVARLGFLLRGDTDRGTDFTCETVWADLEAQTDAQRIDSLITLQKLGLPRRALWKMIPGASEATVARWIEEADAEPPVAPPDGSML